MALNSPVITRRPSELLERETADPAMGGGKPAFRAITTLANGARVRHGRGTNKTPSAMGNEPKDPGRLPG